MEKQLLIFFLFLLLQTAVSFIFRSSEDDENINTSKEPVLETKEFPEEHQEGWFGMFSRKKDESKNDVTEKLAPLPVLSEKWMIKFKELINKLTKMNTSIKESTLPMNIFKRYNSSVQHLTELKNTLEETFESQVMDKYNSSIEAITHGKKVFLSYNWFEKYSEALDSLNEINTSIDNSIITEFNKITEALSGLKTSWEQFSFYKLWQEQYKNLAKRHFSWNSSMINNDWFQTNFTSGDLFGDLKSSLPNVGSYQDMIKQYLPSLEKTEPVCTSKVLTCPDNKQKFIADACCSPLWLSIGAPLGLGNECWMDLNVMVEQCDVFSCYGLENGTFSSSDGCTYMPDMLLNFEACVIHDLCYVTPDVTKAECDLVMRDNINKIYCDNVNTYERSLCSIRASLAATALEWTDRYFVAAGLAREKCQLADTLLTRIWKYSVNRMFRPIF